MSYNETKSVLRAEIPQLKGKSRTEALEYFRQILGEPDDVDIWDGEVDFFEYEEKNHTYIPVEEYSYGKTDDDRWGGDLILAYSNDYGVEEGDMNYSLEELSVLADKMARKFNINPKNIRLLSYTWYNGSDEPRFFERTKQFGEG